MLRAYYVLVTYPRLYSDNDRNLETGTRTHTVVVEEAGGKGAIQILEVGTEKREVVGEKAGEGDVVQAMGHEKGREKDEERENQ
jgi:hypothetical protein